MLIDVMICRNHIENRLTKLIHSATVSVRIDESSSRNQNRNGCHELTPQNSPSCIPASSSAGPVVPSLSQVYLSLNEDCRLEDFHTRLTFYLPLCFVPSMFQDRVVVVSAGRP